MTEPQDSSQGRYVVHFATGQEVTRTASSWAALVEEYEGRGFQPGDFLIVPVDEPLTDEQVADVDFEQAAAAERAGERALEPTIERVQVTHLPGRYGGRITHPWRWELTAPNGEIRYFDTKREALAWWDENRPTTDDAHIAHARYLGADAALAAASWLTMSESDARSILDGDGDPEVEDRYDGPNLSGEWADDPTPYRLAFEVIGHDAALRLSVADAWDETEQAIATAWEEGRDGCWSDAVEAFAYRVVGNIPMALAIEASNEAYVASLRTAAGL